MIVIFVMVAPLVVGLGVILMIARYAPNVPRTAPLLGNEIADARPEITGDEFKDLIEELVDQLGLHTVFSSMGTGGVVEMTLRDEKPLSGGRILLQATPVLQGQLDAVEVLGFAEGVRADMGALKGIFIALAGFTDEAKTSVQATPAPVDLIDGEGLLELVRTHLSPEREAQMRAFRGFGRRFPARPPSRDAGADDEGDEEVA
ncbi:MAG: restriction endonuclease [Myxococcales bacterium]|nr:restriction endonuclease [Myxococcales bacterium]